MKKLLFILLTIPLIFGSCEKEDDSPNSNSNNGNNPIIPTGTTGYKVDNIGGNNYEIYKTTNSGNSWTLEGTHYWTSFNQQYDIIDFVN